jgi:hypothetical protein
MTFIPSAGGARYFATPNRPNVTVEDVAPILVSPEKPEDEDVELYPIPASMPLVAPAPIELDANK